MNRAQRNKRYRELIRAQANYERIWMPRIYAALRKQIDPVINSLRQNGPVATLAILDTLIIGTPIDNVLSTLYRTVGVSAANDSYGALVELYPEIRRQKAFGFNRFWADIMNAFYSLWGAQNVTNITNTERKRIRNVLIQGIEDNLTVEQYIKVLRSPDVDKRRARLIARTEAKMASGKGNDVGAKQTGYLMNKTWLSARDKRTRVQPRDQTDHYHMHLKTAGPDEYFLVPNIKGHNLMLYPGDTTMGTPPSQLCNCRCVVTHEPARDANGRLIRM